MSNNKSSIVGKVWSFCNLLLNERATLGIVRRNYNGSNQVEVITHKISLDENTNNENFNC